MLESIEEYNYGTSAYESRYRFSYNQPEKLPGYLSNMTDHWGFFNNVEAPLDLLGSYQTNRNATIVPAYALYGMLEKIEYPEETLKDYIYGQTFHHIPPEKQIICVPINVSEDLFFVNKSIKNSRIRERYKGSVIGIERNNLPITHPNISTVIQPGDLLWVIGTKEMATKMFKDDILGKV